MPPSDGFTISTLCAAMSTPVTALLIFVRRRLHARILPNQRTEARIGCNVPQPDDRTRHAGLRPDRLMPEGEEEDAPAGRRFMHQDTGSELA
jgi:hypothetical protein